VSLADAPDRETAWLTTSGDGLPALLTANGGPWDVIQAYLPRTPQTRKTQLYVARRRYPTHRIAQQRRRATHYFHLICYWPIGATTAGTGIAEDEQRALDSALALLVQRIEGFEFDKTHGGRFQAVAEGEDQAVIDVQLGDLGQDIANGVLTAQVIYTADDTEYIE
jgi:hypothetical protein